MDIVTELFWKRAEILERNREIFKENEKIKKATFDGILEYNEEQIKNFDLYNKAKDKLELYKKEVQSIDGLIEYLNKKRIKLVEAIDKNELYIKNLKKPQEFKSFCVDIPSPKFESVKDIETKILENLNKKQIK